MEFFKYHSLGNDYILFNALEQAPALAPEDIRMLCDRHMGIGADGIILIEPSRRALCRMTNYNPDGSEAGVSGNGLRCLAKHLFEMDIFPNKEMTAETRSGVRTVKLQVLLGTVHGVEVNMGRPDFRRSAIPMAGEQEEAVQTELEAEGMCLRATCLSMGTSHCVLFLDALNDSLFFKLGPALEQHPCFPLRVNVEFAQVINMSEISLRSWERGCGRDGFERRRSGGGRRSGGTNRQVQTPGAGAAPRRSHGGGADRGGRDTDAGPGPAGFPGRTRRRLAGARENNRWLK